MADFISSKSDYSTLVRKVLDQWIADSKLPDWVFSQKLRGCLFFHDHEFFEPNGIASLQAFENERLSPQDTQLFLVTNFREVDRFYSNFASYPALQFGLRDLPAEIADKIWKGPAVGSDIRAGYSEAVLFSSLKDWFIIADGTAELSIFAAIDENISKQFKLVSNQYVQGLSFEEVLSDIFEVSIRPERLKSYRDRFGQSYFLRRLE